MDEAIFERDRDRFVPTELARGPWDAGALHGGAPAALLARAVELHRARPEMVLTRLTYEFTRPVPMAPLSISTRMVRAGRRAELVEARLASGETEVCRVTALRLRGAPTGLDAPSDAPALAGPEHGRAVVFSLAPTAETSFAASAMEMRFLSGGTEPGPAEVWMRLRQPLLAEERPSGVQRAVAAADFGNGVSACLDFDRYTFVNADLTVYLHRPPAGEWICLEARTRLAASAGAVAESALHDRQGPVGRALQGLVVARRSAERDGR